MCGVSVSHGLYLGSLRRVVVFDFNLFLDSWDPPRLLIFGGKVRAGVVFSAARLPLADAAGV